MLFNSLMFLFVFLPITMAVYFAVDIKLFGGGQNNSERKQIILNFILVLFSLAFFAWDNVGNVWILLSLILFNYIAGMAWRECRSVLLLGVFYDLFILFKYKYLSLVLSFFLGKTEEIIAPLGISFIIFHCISYLMDLYQRKAEPEHNLIHFSLYITFFPKLIQGPIVKYRDMETEIKNRERVCAARLSSGLMRFIIGLSKKVLIADLLGETVSEIFSLVFTEWGIDVLTAWIGCLAYTMQIYMDFSGYSDMAIGLGRIFGFHMEENFNFPYRSTSITEFWRRWHISLGSWFREYLYIPLGGNRTGNVYVNLFLVFVATGIWHGAGVLFLLWGIGHGLCVMLERKIRTKRWYQNVPDFIKWAATMLLVSVGWLTFRLPDLETMVRYLAYMVGNGRFLIPGYIPFTWQYFLTVRFAVLVGVSALGIYVLGNGRVYQWWKFQWDHSVGIQVITCGVLLFLWCLCFVTIVATEYSPFIYFQF